LVFNAGLKLIAALRRNNVVVAAEIEGPGTSSDRREYARAFTAHVIEPESHQFVDQSAGTFLIVIPRRIFGWNRDQALRKVEHRRFREAFSQPERNLLGILDRHPLLNPFPTKLPFLIVLVAFNWNMTFRSVRKRSTPCLDAYPVIGKCVVHAWDFNLWHMTAHATLFACLADDCAVQRPRLPS
jgi:hypothetical protein